MEGLTAASTASLGSAALSRCPSETTLQASSGGNKSAVLTTPNCASVTTIELTAASGDGASLALHAQKLGVVHYIHATEFPATAMNLSENPLQSVDLTSASANLTHIILSSCNLSSLAGLTFPQGDGARELSLDLSKNSLETIERDALPNHLTSLSLSNNALASLVNASFPAPLARLLLADNAIKRIESTPLPPNLQLLDLQGNPLQSVEIRAKDVPIFQKAVVLPTIHQAKCADSRAALHTINSHQVCVISDTLFEQKTLGASAAAAANSPSEAPETTVGSPVTSSDSTLSIVLGLLYAVIGLAAVIAAVFIARKMAHKRRAQRESDQINEYLDARELTPPPELFLSGTSSVTRNSALNSRTWRLSNKLPRLQSQSPRGFLRPLLRVLSGVKHEPSPLPAKPAASGVDNSAVEDCSGATVLGSNMCVALTLEDLTVPAETMTLGRLVYRGSFTYLYLAKIHESDGKSDGGRVVVACQPRSRHNAHQVQIFMDTVNRNLTLKHPNIVSLVGFTHLSQVPTALTEHLPKGDLEGLLQSVRLQSRQSFQWFQRGEGTSLPKSKAEIALDVIDALVYLHSLPTKVCFHNLRAKKVLLTEDFTAKLCAFGNDSDRIEAEAKSTAAALSGSSADGRCHSSSVSASSSPTVSSISGSNCSPSENSVAWMAPELLRGHQDACEKTDIYAFGVLLTELDTCELPYSLGIDDLDRNQVALLVSSGCIRPSVATDCPVQIQELIQKCLSFSPEDRPHSVEIQYALRKLVKKSHSAACSPKEGGGANDQEEPVADVKAGAGGTLAIELRGE